MLKRIIGSLVAIILIVAVLLPNFAFAGTVEMTAVTHIVNGKPLDCVYSSNKYHTLSCNWVKYEADAAKCRAVSLEYRTVINNEGGTIVFPSNKNEC